MITIINDQVVVKVDEVLVKEWLSKILLSLGCSSFDIGVKFVGDLEIHKLNKNYRGKDEPTDILSFPGEKLVPGELPNDPDYDMGDLIINLNRVLQDAQELDEAFELRLKKILIHGACHLLGYNHYTEKNDKALSELESLILKKIK